jgi:hypothetical protein
MAEVDDVLETAKTLGSSTGGTLQNVAAAAGSGAAIGTAIFPGIGTAIGAAIGVAAKFVGIQGKTQTYTWEEANELTRTLAQSIAKEVQTKLSPTQFDALAKDLPYYAANYIETSGAWDQAAALSMANQIRTDTPWDAVPYEIVWQSIWRVLMWITQQCDRARPEELNKFWTYYLDKTLVYKVTTTGYDDYVISLPSTGNAPGTTGTPSTTSTTTTTGTSSTTNAAKKVTSGTVSLFVPILAVALIALFVIWGKN